MQTCKSCIHYNLCKYNAYQEARRLGTDKEKLIIIDNNIACKFSKDSSQVSVLPCKVGQTVWFIRNNKIIETTVEKIVLKSKGIYLKLGCNAMYETSCNSIGKTIFFTIDEAEKALKITS